MDSNQSDPPEVRSRNPLFSGSPSESKPDYSFSKEKHVRLKKDFAAVRAADQKLYAKPFFILYLANNLPHNRLGLVVSKKVSKLAVDRNRVKRRFREVFRLNPAEQETYYDLVIIARRETLTISYQELERQYLKMLNYLRKQKKS